MFFSYPAWRETWRCRACRPGRGEPQTPILQVPGKQGAAPGPASPQDPPGEGSSPRAAFQPLLFSALGCRRLDLLSPLFVRKSFFSSCKFVTRRAPGLAARCHSQSLVRPPLKLQHRALLPRWVFSLHVLLLQEDERLPWLDFEGWAGPCCAASCGCACGMRLQSCVLRGAGQ